MKRKNYAVICVFLWAIISAVNPIPPKPFFQATFEFWFLGLSNR